MREPSEASVHKALLDKEKSAFRKYTDLFIGRKGLFQFAKYELILLLFCWIPGALGLFLRRMFYPLCLKRVGREENQGITIGQNVIVGRNTILSCKGGSITLDDYANISSNCTLLSETRISVGKYTFLAGHCYLVAGGNHSFDRIDIPIMFQPSQTKGGIEIGEDCWLGASVTVLDGISLGRGCVIGAGSVVIESMPEYAVVVGNPARKIKDRKG